MPAVIRAYDAMLAARHRTEDPYRDEMLRRVIARTPLGFAVFLGCLALSALFETLHFPDRRGWVATFATAFVCLVALCQGLLRRRPAWTVPVLLGFVNVVGVALNAYHVIVGASLAACVWVLTGLVASAAVILPWGARNQALACLGALLSYPLHLVAGTADPLTWGAGGTYLVVAASLSVFGAALFAIVSMRGLPGPHGGIDHVMVLVQDITDRKLVEAERERYLQRAEAARERAEEASRAKDEFLATVSHELRTPLTPILAWSSMLRTGELGTDKTAVALGAIEQSARTQAQLIDDLLDVSRIVSGEWRVTRGPREVAEPVDAAVGLILPAAEARGVRPRNSLPEPRVAVPGDPDRLQQVITNLVSNAVKFTPPGGHVDVTLERAETRARIVVRDTGEGIDPGFLPHVFERFRQAD